MNVAVRRRHLGSRHIELVVSAQQDQTASYEIWGCEKVDWGDGASEENSTPKSTVTLEHVYFQKREYRVRFYGSGIRVFTNKGGKTNPEIKSIKFSGVRDMSLLDLSNSKLPDIDVSSLVKLKQLILTSCRIKELNLENNTKLVKVFVADNKLTKIDITMLEDLEELSIYDNKIGPSLNTSNNTKLRILWIQRLSTLKHINISNNLLIDNMAIVDSGLVGTLDISHLSKLRYFSAYRASGLEDLVIGNHPEIVNFRVSNCGVREINTAGISNATEFWAYSCPNLTELDLTNMRNATYIDVSSCSLTSVDVSQCTKLKRLEVYGNNLTELVLTNSIEYLAMGMQNELIPNEVHLEDFSKLRVLDAGTDTGRIYVKFFMNKKYKNIPVASNGCVFLARGNVTCIMPDAQQVTEPVPFVVELEKQVKQHNLYYYPQSFFMARSLTSKETKDLFSQITTLVHDSNIMTSKLSAANIFPSSQFAPIVHPDNFLRAKESITIKCKPDAEFFVYPQSNGGLAFDKRSRVMYKDGVATTKGGAKAVKRVVSGGDVELDVTLEVTDIRNTWKIGIFENKYTSETDPYKSKIIETRTIES